MAILEKRIPFALVAHTVARIANECRILNQRALRSPAVARVERQAIAAVVINSAVAHRATSGIDDQPDDPITGKITLVERAAISTDVTAGVTVSSRRAVTHCAVIR